MKMKKLVSGIAALTMVVSAFSAMTFTASADETSVEQTLTGHVNVLGSSTYSDTSSLAQTETQIYINKYKGGYGQGAVAFTLDDDFDAAHVTNATLELYVSSKASASRSGNITFSALSALPTLSGSNVTGPTTYDNGNATYAYGGTGTNGYSFGGTDITSVSASTASTSYMKTGEYNAVDLRRYIQCLGTTTTDESTGETTTTYPDAVYIGMTTDFVPTMWIDGYGGDNPPKLTITYTDEEMADYTVKYVDESGNVLKTAKEDRGIVGDKVTLVDSDKEDIYDSNGQKYIYSSDDSGSQTIASGDSTVITVTFKKAAVYTMKVVASTGQTIIDEDTVYEGDTFSYSYPEYLQDENGKVVAQYTTNSTFAVSTTPTASGTITIPYTEYTGTAYVYEAEDSIKTTAYTSNNISNGKGRRSLETESHTIAASVPEDGIYKVTLVGAMNRKDKVYGLSVYKNSTSTANTLVAGTRAKNAANAGTQFKDSAENITLARGDALLIQGTEDSNTVADYVLIEKTGEIPYDMGYTFGDNNTMSVDDWKTKTLTIKATNAEGKTAEATKLLSEITDWDTGELSGNVKFGLILTGIPDGVTIDSVVIE